MTDRGVPQVETDTQTGREGRRPAASPAQNRLQLHTALALFSWAGSPAAPPKSPSGKAAPTWRGVMGRRGGGEVELVLEVLLVLLLPLQAGLLPEAGGLLPADRRTDRHRDGQGGRCRVSRGRPRMAGPCALYRRHREPTEVWAQSITEEKYI